VDLEFSGRHHSELTWHPLQKSGTNQLEIEVTNLWPNRLIGDEQLPDHADWVPLKDPITRNNGMGTRIETKAWPDWLLKGEDSPTGRLTFMTHKHYFADSPLLPSGLIGPAQLEFSEIKTDEKN
jgi:hypothetical protein